MAMHKSLRMTWRKQALKSGERNTSSSPSKSPIASKHFHNTLSSSYCSLLFRVTSFSESKPYSQHRNCHSPLLRLRLGFLGFFKGGLLPNVKTLSTVCSWRLEFSSSKTYPASYARICLLGLTCSIGYGGARDVSAERRKSRWRKLGHDCISAVQIFRKMRAKKLLYVVCLLFIRIFVFDLKSCVYLAIWTCVKF